MLALFFEIGAELYALPARAVVEVVPRVALHVGLGFGVGTPAWLLGQLAYRGCVLPVIDLCQRVGAPPCADLLSSRIVIVECLSSQARRRYGILGERVTEVRALSDSKPNPAPRDAAAVVGTLLEQGRLVQLLDLEHLLPAQMMQASEG